MRLLRSLIFLATLPATAQSTQPTTILVHAHRGGRAARPENSIPSFQHGIDVGADVLELDLAVTKDNVLVISHSPYLTQPAAETFSSDPKMAAVVAGLLAWLRMQHPPLHP